MDTGAAPGRSLFVVIALVAVLILGQWAATSTAPTAGVADTGRLLGRTGFAYLGGVRTFAAAVLWNRLDPQFHEYYGTAKLTEMDFAIPTMRLVVALDPQFTQAYQVSSFIIFQKVGQAQGIDIAQEGVANNPRSGIMRSNLAQLLFLHDKAGTRDEVLEHIEAGLEPSSVWLNAEEEYEGLATMRSLLTALGEGDRAPGIDARLAELREHEGGAGDHDHDGDGKQDH